MAVDAPGRLCAEASSDIFKPRAIFRSGCDPHQLMQVVATELAITWRFFRNGVTETKSSRGARACAANDCAAFPLRAGLLQRHDGGRLLAAVATKGRSNADRYGVGSRANDFPSALMYRPVIANVFCPSRSRMANALAPVISPGRVRISVRRTLQESSRWSRWPTSMKPWATMPMPLRNTAN
jgi:hypothetical protein